MALRHAVLAALMEGEASGYQLAKRFDISVANFWAATPQQLYRELGRLADEKLVRGRTERQDKLPDKRVFNLTAAGRRELAAFAAAPTRPSALRDDLLVKVQAADDASAGAVAEALDDRATQARAKRARYQGLLDGLLDGRDEATFLAEAERIGPYLTLQRGLAFEIENEEWCERAAAVLRARSAVTA